MPDNPIPALGEAPGFPAQSPCLAPAALAGTLAALVGINSVNPGYGGPPGGERAAMEWAAGFLRAAGLDPRLTGPPARPNLRVRLDGRHARGAILFESHLDTVSIEGMTIEPFAARIAGGRLWGRGATDAKAQATALLHALAAWAASGRRPPQAVELALVSDEEFGFGGARALLEEWPEVAGVVIGEPTDLRVVTTHKGTVRQWIRVEGKAAHAAKPHLGINAIAGAAALIAMLEGPYAEELRRRRAPLLGPPTISTGLIQGGVQANLVPPECRLHVDRRTIPGESYESFAAELKELIARARRERPELRAALEPPTLIAAPLHTDPDGPLARAAGQAAAAHGISPEPAGVDYATDGSILAAAGVPIVVLGPGSIDQAHTADEFIELEQLARGARLFADLMGREIV